MPTAANRSTPMNGEVLLDRNIAIALFDRDGAVEAALGNAAEGPVPSIVLGELYYGANHSERVAENLAKIGEFGAASSVLLVDAGTAHHYGRIKNAVRLKGRPLPENDIWIAAIAEQHELTVISRDEHFRQIEGLLIARW